MPRVLVLNNYPFESVWEEVKRGEKPDHHLYGINYFEQRSYQVELIPFQTSLKLQQLNRLLSKVNQVIPFGDLDQQWSCLERLNQADLIYAPCQTQTALLSYLRAMGWLKIPLICIAHHPVLGGRLERLKKPLIEWTIQGIDALPSLNQYVSEQINQLSPGKSQLLQWGPQIDFYPQTESIGKGVVAAGRTGRDFITFGLAASGIQAKAQVICLQSSVTAEFGQFGSNVSVQIEPDQGYMMYPQLNQIYAAARVLAIPLYASRSLAGLTSLMDALGIGKPVIMTRNPLIDLDIEALGVGLWVNPGDIEGWRKAITFFEENEQEAREMGRRARALVTSGLNSAIFAQQVMDIFDRVLR